MAGSCLTWNLLAELGTCRWGKRTAAAGQPGETLVPYANTGVQAQPLWLLVFIAICCKWHFAEP